MTDSKTRMWEQHFTVYKEPLNPLFYSSLLECKFLYICLQEVYIIQSVHVFTKQLAYY